MDDIRNKKLKNDHLNHMVEELDIAAIIAAGIAAGISLWSIHLTKKSDMELEVLRNRLGLRKDEAAARIDYEYEARKRLYNEFEPILFQFFELCGIALKQIYSIARDARAGHLSGDENWLSSIPLPGDNNVLRLIPDPDEKKQKQQNYMVLTMYRLIAPMAAFKLLKRKLTLVDLALDPIIKIEYNLANRLYLSFSDDLKLEDSVEGTPKIATYAGSQAPSLKQGFYSRDLDMLTEDMIKGCNITSIGGFSNYFFRQPTDFSLPPSYMSSESIAAIKLFSNFNPGTHCILWRILLAQAHIYQALLRLQEMNVHDLTEKGLRIVIRMSKEDLAKLNWRETEQDNKDPDLLAVEKYLQSELEDYFIGAKQ